MSSHIPEQEVPAEASIQKFHARDKSNSRWSNHFINKLFTVATKPIFGPDDVVFAIGSCFAERIRIAMSGQSVRVGPPMEDIVIDEDRFRIDSLPQRPHMNYYNSFTIRQEFERHVGEWSQGKDDYWTIKDKIWGGKIAYQDPYRRMILGRTPEDLGTAVERVNIAIDKGIREASVFFITLGMAEVFVNKTSGSIVCQKPGYAGGAGENETSFHMSGYEENFANMAKVVEIINRIRPDAHIVVTVSPVGLARTFSNNDILAANTEGKSILRASLTYFPSYEMVMYNSPVSFRANDGRHVDDWIVSKIVRMFKEVHYDENYGAQTIAAQ